MEEDRLSILSNLLSQSRDLELDISIVLYSDLSGHFEQGFFESKRVGTFMGIDDLIVKLASLIQKREYRRQYTENILQKFTKMFK